MGMDLQLEYLDDAKKLAEEQGVSHLVEVVAQDFTKLEFDCNKFLQQATAVYMYLMPKVLEDLMPLIKECVESGVKVVTFYHHLEHVEGGIAPQRKGLMGT